VPSEPRLGRTLVFRTLRLSGLPWLLREALQRRRVTVILYHDPDPELFERHLHALRRRYSIIRLRDFANALRAGETSRLPLKPLVITLDDGHRGNHELMPVLERTSTPVTIFLCSDIVGSARRYWFLHAPDRQELKRLPDEERLARLEARGYAHEGAQREALSDEEIRAMTGPLVDFQSHTRSHPILPRCPDGKARSEVIDSRRELAERYGLDIYAFSYPNGDYGERELALAREAGYACAITVDPGYNGPATDPYRLKRIALDDSDGVDELLVKVSGLWGVLRTIVGRR
jgi:peptidoglycan/xylan/chitin deacetylase (PgdA/CDA1 family)